jgi:hypothetical protein
MLASLIEKPKLISTKGCSICTYWIKYHKFNLPDPDSDITLPVGDDGQIKNSNWGRCSNHNINKCYKMWNTDITEEKLIVRIINNNTNKDITNNSTDSSNIILPTKCIVSTNSSFGCELCLPSKSTEDHDD